PPAISTLSLHDALPIFTSPLSAGGANTLRLNSTTSSVTQNAAGVIATPNLGVTAGSDILLDQAANFVTGTTAFQSGPTGSVKFRSEEHTSELQSRSDLV